MTQKDKELLMKDLCARLPYGVVIRTWYGKRINIKCISVNVYTNAVELDIPEDDDTKVFIDNVKPYLFPLSSMTEEQRQEFLSVAGYEVREEDCGRHTETYYYDMVGHENTLYPNCDAIDWLNAHHFDYRGLIEKGLAIDATGLNVY